MRYCTLIPLVLSVTANATTKVAIIDTGLDITDPRFTHLCATGHKDLVGTGIKDTLGHGTHIAGLIQKYAGDADYCLVILKYYDENANGLTNFSNELKAVEWAISVKADFINISAGGASFSEKEFIAISEHPEIKFIVAAGNNGQNLDKSIFKFYPASYELPNIIAVGNGESALTKAPTSNYGKRVKSWENGEMVSSFAPCDEAGKFTCEMMMSGTSQATAIHTGKLIKERK